MIGQVDTVTHQKIAGWISSDLNSSTVLDLVISEILIRSQRADFRDPKTTSRMRFTFAIGESLRQKLPADALIDVRVAQSGLTLPFSDDVSRTYPGQARDKGEELRSLLADKWHIDHWGNMHVSFAKDPALVDRCARIYTSGRELVQGVLDTELYVTGGNLLGLVREGKFLDHDDDIDASLILPAETPEEAAEKFFAIVERLAPAAKKASIRLRVAHPLHLYMIKPGLPYLDVLAGWLTSSGYWCRPSGYGGDLGIDAFQYYEVDYAGTRMAIPSHAETELALTYGKRWRCRDDNYSKVRPEGPLKQIQKLQTRYKSRVREMNDHLDQLFDGEG